MLRDLVPSTLRCGKQILDLSRPVVMGILNATPDSFHAGSRLPVGSQAIVDRAGAMLRDGAAILDIGGMSSRPGAIAITEQEESDRVMPVVEALVAAFPEAILSVDTYRARIAREALSKGVGMVNDISGAAWDPDMLRAVSEGRGAYVLMHVQGTMETMHKMTEYEDLVGDVLKYFVSKLRTLKAAGLEEIVLDPGFGFSKSPRQNFQLIDRLTTFRLLGRPLLVGISRKSTLSRTIGRPTEETLAATTALHMMALHNGANILRVHDVREAMDAMAVFRALEDARRAEVDS